MQRLRVGIVGANPGRGWAGTAHIPALKALPQYEILGVATTKQASADAAAKHYGIPLAFGDAGALARHPDIDVVAVTVKVPGHHAAVMAALDAGKAVYCEWPLGLDSAQAQRMLERARERKAAHLVGLQGHAQPEVNHLKDLVARGHVGEVLSCTMIVSSRQWGPVTEPASAYLFDRNNGATMLTIPGGHSVDALCYCLGEFKSVSAVVATRRPEVQLGNEKLAKTAPDQVSISGVLQNGAVASIHVRGGTTHGTPFLLEVQGTDGVLALTTPGSVQYSPLELRGARGKEEMRVLPLPAGYRKVPSDVPPGAPFSVAQVYAGLAESLQSARPPAPGFDAAVVRHRMIEAIQRSSDTGQRVTL